MSTSEEAGCGWGSHLLHILYLIWRNLISPLDKVTCTDIKVNFLQCWQHVLGHVIWRVEDPLDRIFTWNHLKKRFCDHVQRHASWHRYNPMEILANDHLLGINHCGTDHFVTELLQKGKNTIKRKKKKKSNNKWLRNFLLMHFDDRHPCHVFIRIRDAQVNWEKRLLCQQ